MKKVVFTTIVVLWMGVIFWFSAQPADDSTEMSLGVGCRVGNWFVPGFDEWSEQEQHDFAASIDYPVRKCAHASEYMLLCFLWYFTLSAYELKKCSYKKMIMLAFVFTVVYAISDEIHQLFVPGRSGRLFDIMIDSLGALGSCGIIFSCHKIKQRITKRLNSTRQCD